MLDQPSLPPLPSLRRQCAEAPVNQWPKGNAGKAKHSYLTLFPRPNHRRAGLRSIRPRAPLPLPLLLLYQLQEASFFRVADYSFCH